MNFKIYYDIIFVMKEEIYISESYEHFALGTMEMNDTTVAVYKPSEHVHVCIVKRKPPFEDLWCCTIIRNVELENQSLDTEQLEFLLGKLSEDPLCDIVREVELFDEVSYKEIETLPTNIIIQKMMIQKDEAF